MKQTLLAIAILVPLVAGIVVVATETATRAQPVLPTPKGQLGGPVPLETPAPPGQPPSPTPPPTPTPEAATPAAGAPHPADCRIVARPVEELIELANDDAPPPPPAKGGAPADAATAGEIYATVHELIACLNAGDQLRAAALLTDDCLTRLLADAGWEPSQVLSILGPLYPRPPERWIALTEVADVQLLPDGRAVATVVLFDPERFTLGGTTAYRVVFQHVADRWLVDAMAGH